MKSQFDYSESKLFDTCQCYSGVYIVNPVHGYIIKSFHPSYIAHSETFIAHLITLAMYFVPGHSYNPAIYVTGFAKRGLPHTSNSLNLEDHNLAIE